MVSLAEFKGLKLEPKGRVHSNLSVDELYKIALERKEGEKSASGALSVNTAPYTGRSPNDRFIVKEPSSEENISWGKSNVPVSEEVFENLYKKTVGHLSKLDDLFVFDESVGSDPSHAFRIRVVNELAWQALFSNQIFKRQTPQELSEERRITVLVPAGLQAKGKQDGVRSEAFILVHPGKKIILVGSAWYGGEIKKSVFALLNYLLPLENVFPMHCSANIGEKGDSALFFGLSGTGKTTLSADPNRRLLGDDEHGWSENGIFNFEGGCYAKAIMLRQEKEPQIWNAIKYGAVAENLVMDSNKKEFDFDDASITENTRVVYPIEHIKGAELSGMTGHPKTVIFLTADAFGVIPPLSRLSIEGAVYHFLSGYTSKLAGTERGIIEPIATFSSCFGEPFMLWKPEKYGELLRKKLEKFRPEVYLVNTGWVGGPYGVGERIDLTYTRAMTVAAKTGKLEKEKFWKHEIFNLMVPERCEGVPDEILNPENSWKDKAAYRKKALGLAEMFEENFKRFPAAPKEVLEAGPKHK